MDQFKPDIINFSSVEELDNILSKLDSEGYIYNDIFECQAEELVELTCIGKEEDLQLTLSEFRQETFGTLIVYPWRKTVIRILEENDFYTLLTSRNKYLINHAEQDKYKATDLAVAGLSVGSNIVLTTVMQGGCKNIKIADGDSISTSNMNRIVTELPSVNIKKTIALARKIYEINPYINVQLFSDGINEENIDEFVKDSDVVFDEIDSLHLKLHMRLIAKDKKIPLIMITDNGDNVMVDIERYDLKSDLKPFHGLISEEDIDLIKKSHGKLSPHDRVTLSLKIVHPQNAVSRMQDSLLEVGKTIKTWPQLSTASMLAGSVGSYIIRNIAMGNPIKDGRLHVSIDGALIPDYYSEESTKKRAEHTKEFLSNLK
jgi:tRNA A37 threonylcarbamoyladenosine dehydratase